MSHAASSRSTPVERSSSPAPPACPPRGTASATFASAPGQRAFAGERAGALHALAYRLRAAPGETNGVEVFAPTGDHDVAFRHPDNIQLECWLDEEP